MKKPTAPRRVSLVEDDAGLRQTLTRLLGHAPGWIVHGCHADAETALPALLAQPPDVVIMDINLPGMSGIECVAQLKQRGSTLPVLILTVYDNNDNVFEALSAGACGYLLKRDAPQRLIESLEEVLEGGSPMSSHIARKVVQFFHRRGESKREAENLTPRERQIVQLLSEGLLDKEISDRLGIGWETVRTHVNSVYRKLQVRSRTEAVVKWLGQA